MQDSVPSTRYSSICNVLRQWRIWLIPTYRVYRLYDMFSNREFLSLLHIFFKVSQKYVFSGNFFNVWTTHIGREPQNHNHYNTARAIFRGAGERNRGYALLMTANKPETALYRAPTFSLLLASHGGINSRVTAGPILLEL